MPNFVVDSVPLPMPAGARSGYGSAIRSLADGTFVTTWLQGAATIRLGHVDATSGRGTAVKGMRGLLRDVVTDPPAGRAWLLCTHGLHEVTLAPLRIIRTLTRGLGTYNLSLHRLGPDIAGVSKRFGRAIHLVSLSRMEIVGRLTMPHPELVLARPDGPLILSFNSRRARSYDHHLKPTGPSQPLPLGITPVATRDAITFIPGTPKARNIAPTADAPDRDRYSSVVADGRIGSLDRSTLTMTHDPGTTPARALHAGDGAGRILGSDRTPRGRGQRMMLLDGHDHHVLVTTDLPAAITDVATLTAQSALVSHDTAAATPAFVSLVTWA